MPSLPGSDAKMIKLNPDWTVDNAGNTPLEKTVSVNDYKGKRLIITLPGAGGFCNKEFDLVKENEEKFKEAGADEVIIIVGTDILSNAGRGLPNLLQDVNLEFGKANGIALDGVQSRYLNRVAIAVDSDGNEIAKEDAPLLACRPLNALLDFTKKAFG